MKNKSLKLLALVMTATMLSGCFNSKGGSTNTSDNNPGEQSLWSSEIQAEMNKYIGEVLPYVQLNESTIYHGYDDTYSSFGVFYYVIGDDNENNVLEGYGDALLAAGYVYDSDDYGEYYDKEINGFTVSVSYEYYDAETDTNPGNEITVMVPQYVDEEYLLAAGYEKMEGWPTALVANAMQGTNKTLAGVNTTGEWFVVEDVFEDTDEDCWYRCLYLATQGDFVEAFGTICSNAGYAYDEDYGCYYNAGESGTDEEIYVYKATGYTLIDIFGPSFDGSAPAGGGGDVGGDETNPDGTITVEFTFGGNLANQTTLNGTGFSTDNASIIFNKGDSNTAPTYYDNGNTVRCYAKNTIVITCLAESYAITSVEMTIGSSNNKKWDNAADLYTLSYGTATATETKTTISGVNQTSLTIGIGMNKEGGNIAFSKITVNLGPVY